MQLTPSQEAAQDAVLSAAAAGQRVISLAGPAGTGKTTMLNSITEAIGGQCVVVTPTNKAAAVLRKKGVADAATVYSVFFTLDGDALCAPLSEAEKKRIAAGLPPTPNPKRKLTFEPNYLVTERARERQESARGYSDFELGLGKLDFADTIVLDEASMLQTWLVQHLKRMCNRIVLIGDPHQLPPVGDKQNPDGYFCTRNHDAELTEVLRQGADSPILGLATHIREGRFPASEVARFAPTRPFGVWYDGSQKLIAFTNAHRRELNMWCRRVLGIQGVLPKPGDKMVCNSTVSDVLFNGTEFEVLSFNWTKNDHVALVAIQTEDGVKTSMLLDMIFFLQDMPPGVVPEATLLKMEECRRSAVAGGLDQETAGASYSYCITAHKAQGSEYPSVCVVDERWILGKVDPTGAMTRRWLYTAITRASETLLFPDYRWFKGSSVARAA